MHSGCELYFINFKKNYLFVANIENIKKIKHGGAFLKCLNENLSL